MDSVSVSGVLFDVRLCYWRCNENAGTSMFISSVPAI